MPSPSSSSLSQLLKGQQFCLLTTFRKDGTPVPTPMWFAVEDETLYMATRGGSAKVKRLRRQPEVEVGPCTGGGQPTGPQRSAIARVLDSSEAARVESLLNARYGLKRRLLSWGLKFARDKTEAHISVRLCDPPSS